MEGNAYVFKPGASEYRSGNATVVVKSSNGITAGQVEAAMRVYLSLSSRVARAKATT